MFSSVYMSLPGYVKKRKFQMVPIGYYNWAFWNKEKEVDFKKKNVYCTNISVVKF